MNSDLNKQDKILATIGLKREMVWQAPTYSVYDNSKFKHYVASEYKESQRKETDEIYRMFELTLLHIESGLRLTLTTSESYDGETVIYKVIKMFIITLLNEIKEVLDVDFVNKIFYTTDVKISFDNTNKLVKQ